MGSSQVTTRERQKGGTSVMNKLKSYLKTRSFGYPAVAAVAVAFLLAGVLITSSMENTAHARTTTPVAGVASGPSPSFADLAEALGPAVVNIKVTKTQKTGMPWHYDGNAAFMRQRTRVIESPAG